MASGEQPTRDELKVEIESILKKKNEKKPTAGPKWDSLVQQVLDLLEVRLKVFYVLIFGCLLFNTLD